MTGNNALGEMLSEAGMSFAGLARRVNDLGASEGKALRYDYTAVNRWVRKGQVPREPAPRLIAVALTERLGRRITPGQFGMPESDSLNSRALEYPTDPADAFESVHDLGVSDMAGGEVTAAPFVASAFGVPSRDWMVSVLAEIGGNPESSSGSISLAQVAGIHDMFALFQQMDVMRGGGHARTALLEYMRSFVAPLLRSDQSPEVRSALFEAAAQQAYLVGWMAYDDGLHGLAQRYLIQALRLAQESGNRALGGHVLAGMSDQANLLGFPKEAVQLARAGLAAAGNASTACRADLTILLARGLASNRESRAARESVEQASEMFAQVDRAAEPEWARFIDPAYLFGEAAITMKDAGDNDAARQYADLSLADARAQGRARRASLSTAVLAETYISDGDLDLAAQVASEVTSFAASVNSSRSRQAVRGLARRLRPASQNQDVADFLTASEDAGLLTRPA